MDNTGKRQHARYYAAEGQDDVLLRQRSRISSEVRALSSTLAICGGVEWRSDLAVMAGVSPPRDAAMPVLPSRFATVILHFAPLFYHRSWRHAEVLLIGAILAPGTRTVASLLGFPG